jgi:transcription elongation factor Elf1
MTTVHAPHRTFDCPWCGAINLVDPSQIGQHWQCPECKKSTKLTASNTSDRPPTAPPPDAPHLSGDRTFDCPWCGAISSVPSSHLGERFACPECRRETKLTSTNARRAPITAPPPDAPPAAPPPAKGVGIAVAVVAVLAGLGLWMAFAGGSSGGGGGSTRSGDAAPTADGAGTERPPATVNPNAKTPGGPPPMPTPPSRGGMDAPAMPEPTAPPAALEGADPDAKPAPALSPEEADRAAKVDKARLEAAATAAILLERSRAREDAFVALGKWMESNPEYVAASAERTALGEVRAEGKRLLEAKELIADPAAPTPAGVRAYNAAVATFVEANPERVKAVEAVIARMKADATTAGEVADRAWKEVNFFGPGFSRTLESTADARAKEMAAMLPADLSKGLADATADESAAKKAAEEADARLQALLEAK